MTDANVAETSRRRKQSAIATMLGMSLVLGILYAALYPRLETSQQEFQLQIVGNMALLGTGFYWLHFDSLERQFRRSTLLNVGIVAIALVFVPYYFYVTREKGSRAGPIIGFLGLIVASSILTFVGMTVMTAFADGNG